MNENGVTLSDAVKSLTVRAELTQETLTVLKDSICKGFSAAEFNYAKELCRALGLNPIKKEVWFIKIRDSIQCMTGINGYFTIANSHPMYNGMEEDVVMNDKTGLPDYAWCKVYRKDREFPQTAKVYFQEYADSSKPLWKSKPCTMILKVAESVALRKAFPQELNGTYTEEEMPGEYARAATPLPSTPLAFAATSASSMTTVGHTITAPNGSAVVTSVAPKSEVITVESAPPKPSYGPTDWSQFPYRYAVVGVKDKAEFKIIGEVIKANGGKFRGKKNRDGTENPDGDNCWYAEAFIEELSRFVDDNPEYKAKPKSVDEVLGGDNIEFNF